MLRTFFVLMLAAFMSFSIVGCTGGEKPAPEQKPVEKAITPAEGSETMPGEEMMEEGEEHPTPAPEQKAPGSGTK